MLHTLNKAWITILANQINNGTISNALFVTFGNVEYIATEKLLQDICELDGCWIFDANDVVFGLSLLPHDIMFDDVLISHAVHDPMLKNYLAKHCRRITHNGE